MRFEEAFRKMQAEGGGMRLPTFDKIAYLCWMDGFVAIYQTGRAQWFRYFHQPWIISEKWQYLTPDELPEPLPVVDEVHSVIPKGSYRPSLNSKQAEMKARYGK